MDPTPVSELNHYCNVNNINFKFTDLHQRVKQQSVWDTELYIGAKSVSRARASTKQEAHQVAAINFLATIPDQTTQKQLSKGFKERKASFKCTIQFITYQQVRIYCQSGDLIAEVPFNEIQTAIQKYYA